MLSRVNADDVVNTVINGLANGGVYAFLALCYSIVFVTSGVFNIAQAQLLVLGGLLGYTLLVVASVPWVLAAIVIIVAAGALALLQYLLTVRPVRVGYGWILTTLGATFLLQAGFAHLWGTEVHPVPGLVSSSPVHLGSIRFIPSQALVVAAVVLIALLLEALMRRTRFGRAWRATSQDWETAAVLGVNVSLVLVFAFVLAGAISGVGGLLSAPVTYANPFGGELVSFKGFLAVAIGGMTSNLGAVAGGLLFGVVEAFSERIIGANFYSVAVFLFALGFLMLRPHGLFAEPSIREV
jgi:branched-chain amino acid transport system permease protein